MLANQYFRAAKISERVTRIYGPSEVLMYLVEGAERAMLIDTGCGLGDLRAFVEQLTDKPYSVLLTHGHVDHAMGAPAFDDVYISPLDREIFNEHREIHVRKGYLQLTMREQYDSIDERDYVPAGSFDKYKPLRPGDCFDLGGMRLEVCIGAGHTPGMVTILLVEERALLLGDACNPFTFLFDEHAHGVTTYMKMLKALRQDTQGRYDTVYLSHGDAAYPVDMIDSVISVCEDILAGRADDIPYTFMEYQAFIAKAVNSEMGRRDGGLGNIVYSKEKVHC